MLASRHLHACLALVLAGISAQAQFTLDLRPVSPGTGELSFTRELGYYHRLEISGDLPAGFSPASGWMLGNGMPATWPIHYPASPSSSGGGTGVAAGDAFALYPFPNGKTLVTWNDLGAGHHSALIAEDYSFLPPLVNVPSTPTTGSLMLLVGNLAWDSAYDALAPTLLPTAQQTTLARFTTRRADVIAAPLAPG